MARRRTGTRIAVLAALLDEPTNPKYGLEIANRARIATGTVYPILAALEADGWVKSQWEASDPSAVGRPRRRFYKLTGIGTTRAHAEIVEFSSMTGGFLVPRAAQLIHQWVGGAR